MTYPGQRQPYPPQPQGNYPPPGWAPPPPPKRRKWPWIVGGVVGFIVLLGAIGGNTSPTTATPGVAATTAAAPTVPAAAVAPPAAPTPTEAPVVDVVLPAVKGKNGAIVYDELQALGLTNVTYASRDAEDKVVVLPANWTAVKIEPKAGSTVKSNATVVVTMTKTG